jgi:uncharacterized protein YchJ
VGQNILTHGHFGTNSSILGLGRHACTHLQSSFSCQALLGYLQEDVTATIVKSKYYKLEILNTMPGNNADEAFVEFRAWYKTIGQLDSKA